MMVWLTVLGIAKRIGAWLTSLSFWQLACIGLALFAGVQTLRLGAEQRHAHKVEAQLSKAVEKLNAISSKRDQQKRETSERIKVVTRTIHDAEGRAKVVEQAPLPGDCKTPPQVMQADL
jgi:hypothetical protein